MNTTVLFDRYLIAPCGINCGTCLAFLREKNKCCGCWPITGNKVNYCFTCSIKNCEFLEKTSSKFCNDCDKFPCRRMKDLDKRYTTKYKTSLIQNLITIKMIGIDNFLLNETKKWTCPKCGSNLCVHRDACPTCGIELNKSAI
jgi:hypothetical protein